MKKIQFIFVIMLLAVYMSSFARVLTVSNHPLGGAQYSTIDAAQSAASPGDTLLIEGTTLNYPTGGFYKQLVIIGPGFNAAKEQFHPAKLVKQGGVFYIGISASASGTKFYGITFQDALSVGATNLYFEDCYFLPETHPNANVNVLNTYGGITSFINCIFGKQNTTGVVISGITSFISCIFNGYIEGNSDNTATTFINHCLFLNSSGNSIQNVYNAVVSNSIFMNVASFAGNVTGEFYNNIGRLATTSNLPPSGCTGANNLTLTDPMFVNYTLGSFYSSSHDYDVQSGSTANNAGNDATDIGVHGGTSSFSETGEVLITPVVRTMLIIQQNILPGGTMDVRIQAGKPNEN